MPIVLTCCRHFEACLCLNLIRNNLINNNTVKKNISNRKENENLS